MVEQCYAKKLLSVAEKGVGVSKFHVDHTSVLCFCCLHVSCSIIFCAHSAGLDYGEEVHWSRILGEWSNMIGYKMDSSPARLYTTAKTSPMENYEHG